jgi:hypothetical protein
MAPGLQNQCVPKPRHALSVVAQHTVRAPSALLPRSFPPPPRHTRPDAGRTQTLCTTNSLHHTDTTTDLGGMRQRVARGGRRGGHGVGEQRPRRLPVRRRLRVPACEDTARLRRRRVRPCHVPCLAACLHRDPRRKRCSRWHLLQLLHPRTRTGTVEEDQESRLAVACARSRLLPHAEDLLQRNTASTPVTHAPPLPPLANTCSTPGTTCSFTRSFTCSSARHSTHRTLGQSAVGRGACDKASQQGRGRAAARAAPDPSTRCHRQSTTPRSPWRACALRIAL